MVTDTVTMKLRTLGFAAVSLSLVALVALVACGVEQKPATFVTSGTPEASIDTVARTLAANGHTAPGVDRRTGIVNTEWKDTGFGYGQVNGANATIVRRFTVVLSPAAQGSSVTVRIDAKRCGAGFTIENNDVKGSCEEISALPGSFQADIDSLSAKIQAALH